MTWILPAAVVVPAGLIVLGVLTARVIGAARALNREVARINQQFRLKADSRG
ncbi:hypothetical protein ACI2LC_17395 [Nonomuraea wenchangensis]|uniref:hypothetical protein n=1 Tax=Nonomuraea wenchangensis TaxID=568860 RepID=UPI0033237B30